MPLLSKRRQVVAVEEIVGGTLASGLTSAANAGFVLTDASATLDIEAVERNILRESLTPVKSSPGQQAAGLTLTTEIAGTSAGTFAAGYPLWGRLLEGCGMRVASVRRIAIGAIAGGPFQHGELLDASTAGSGAGRVVIDTHNGATEIYYEVLGTTIGSGETLTGQSSGATATTSSTTTNEGYAFMPVSNVVKQLTAALTSGTVYKGSLIEGATSGSRAVVAEDLTAAGALKFYPVRGGAFTGTETLTIIYEPTAGSAAGFAVNAAPAEQFIEFPSLSMRFIEDGQAITVAGARGSVSFNFEVNRPVTASFTFRGSLNSTDDQALISGVSADAPASPPIWQGSAIGYSGNETSGLADLADELEPCLTALSLDLGVTLSDRRCAAASTGLEEVLGTARAGTGSMDPEVTLEADIPWLSYLKNGTTTRLRVPVGSSDGNRFTFFMPGVQFTGQSYGDRDGIATYDLPFNLTGGYHHNVAGSGTQLDVYGGDNELVLIYFTS
jgi:hypothetical protein